MGHPYHTSSSQGSGIHAEEEPEGCESQGWWCLQGSRVFQTQRGSGTYELPEAETACTKPVQIYTTQNPHLERGGEPEVWQLISCWEMESQLVFFKGIISGRLTVPQHTATYLRVWKQHKLDWRDFVLRHKITGIRKEGNLGGMVEGADYDQMHWTRFSEK